jgi:hypothetical protein
MSHTRVLGTQTPAFGVSVTRGRYGNGQPGIPTADEGRAKPHETLADAVAAAAETALALGLEGRAAAQSVRAEVLRNDDAFTGELKAVGGGLAVLDALIVAVAGLPRP